jgi:hypothetical protein
MSSGLLVVVTVLTCSAALRCRVLGGRSASLENERRAPSARRNARCSEPIALAGRENYRLPYDQWPRYAIKIRDRHHRSGRARLSSAGGSGGHHRFACDDPQEGARRVGPWLERAYASLIASFANDVTKDKAAITTSWSNGQTEGQITKLKLVKRQMYGRKLDCSRLA